MLEDNQCFQGVQLLETEYQNLILKLQGKKNNEEKEERNKIYKHKYN